MDNPTMPGQMPADDDTETDKDAATTADDSGEISDDSA